MSYKIMPKAVFADWVKQLGQNFRVVGPQEKFGTFVFAEIDSVEDLRLNYPPTVLPPKKYLVPPREVLLNYNLDASRIRANIVRVPTVIIGLHTCDLHAIKLLDRVFQQCLAPCTDHSFCRDMGTASSADGYDIHILELDDVYALNVNTRKGLILLEGFHHAFEAMPSDMERINGRYAEKWEKFPYRLDFDIVEMSDLLAGCYESELWDELGERCLACGMCTQVCPTCYCFDVTDEADLALEEGQRVRRWDSCQIHQFARVAGGHDFRAKLSARQRHRFMRKGKYQWDGFGLVGCVGCGRCATSCLVDITPIGVFNELFRRAHAAEKSTHELLTELEVVA